MNPPRPIHDLEIPISRLLRTGSGISLVLVILGFGISLFQLPRAGNAPAISHLGQIFSGLARGDGQAIIMLGLLVLVATPVLRVTLSCLLFLRDRDRRYALITFLVLLLLLTSFLIGKAEA
jgi:uncharacterized membrane protein